MLVTVGSINMRHGVRYLLQLVTELQLKTFGTLVHQHIRDQDLVADQVSWLQSGWLRKGLPRKYLVSKRKSPQSLGGLFNF
jgi:hypothetical protein